MKSIGVSLRESPEEIVPPVIEDTMFLSPLAALLAVLTEETVSLPSIALCSLRFFQVILALGFLIAGIASIRSSSLEASITSPLSASGFVMSPAVCPFLYTTDTICSPLGLCLAPKRV